MIRFAKLFTKTFLNNFSYFDLKWPILTKLNPLMKSLTTVMLINPTKITFETILINSILLTFKMLLYKNKESNCFNLTQFIKNIKSREKIESAIARESGKLLFHSGNGKF